MLNWFTVATSCFEILMPWHQSLALAFRQAMRTLGDEKLVRSVECAMSALSNGETLFDAVAFGDKRLVSDHNVLHTT